MNDKQFLALLEVDQIQDYIFATNKLREIRGASSLLLEINEERTPEILLKKYPSAKPILSVGGMTKATFHNEDEARAFLNELEKVYKEELISVSVTTHIEPINGNFPAAIRKGEKAIRRKKESKQYSFQLNTSPYHKRCSLCSVYPAIEKDRDQNNKKHDWLCASCSAKREQSRKWLPIHDKIQQKFEQECKKISEFSDIGKASQKEGYMGFIMADANRMGEKIRDIQEPEELRQFSEEVKKTNETCLIDAICHAFPEIPKNQILPINVLILGGDDMVMVTTADTAMKIAVEYCKKFQEDTRKPPLSIPEGISISAGVVIAKDSYPINSYVALGEELLKIAKKKSRDYLTEGKNVGTIDYKVVTASSAEPIRITRYKKERYYQRKSDAFSLTFKPYSLKDMERLIDFCVKFKENNFPRNKIKALEKILRLGREESILEFLTLKSRLSNREHKKLMAEFLEEFKLIDQIPWRTKDRYEYETNLLDLVEIYDFCQKE